MTLFDTNLAQALREKLVNQKTLAVLAQKYDLVNRLVPPPNSQPSLILASTTARVAVFQAYIAAIRRQYGYEIMLDFLRDLYSSGEWEKAYSVDADVL